MKNTILILFVSLSLTMFNDTATAGPLQELQQQIDQHRGDVIYLDFWASWCGPCRKSFPWLENIEKKYSNQGFYVISVNVDSDRSLASQFLREFPVTFDVIYDPDGEVAEHFQIKGMPTGFILNRQGKFTEAHIGFYESKVQSYEAKLQKLLRG